MSQVIYYEERYLAQLWSTTMDPALQGFIVYNESTHEVSISDTKSKQLITSFQVF